MLLAGINYCSAWTAWIKLFTTLRNIPKFLELTCFLSAGIPWGIQLETNQIKQVEENLVGRSRGGGESTSQYNTIWKCTFVPLDKNRLNHWLNHHSGNFTNPQSCYALNVLVCCLLMPKCILSSTFESFNSEFHLWTWKSQEDQIRPLRKKRLCLFSLWFATNISHLCWPESQSGNQMGTLLPHWSNKQWCKLWKVVCGKPSELLDGLLEKVTTV